MDHFVLRRRRLPARVDSLHGGALLAWAGGVLTYHLLANYAPDVGATLPALLLAGLLYGVLGLSRGRETVPA